MVAPVPTDVIVPGYRVSIHVPVAGKLFNTTLPTDEVHVGGVIVPTAGVAGMPGCASITTLVDSTDVHPAELVTV